VGHSAQGRGKSLWRALARPLLQPCQACRTHTSTYELSPPKTRHSTRAPTRKPVSRIREEVGKWRKEKKVHRPSDGILFWQRTLQRQELSLYCRCTNIWINISLRSGSEKRKIKMGFWFFLPRGTSTPSLPPSSSSNVRFRSNIYPGFSTSLVHPVLPSSSERTGTGKNWFEKDYDD